MFCAERHPRQAATMASAQKRSNGKWLGRYRAPDGKERGKSFARKGDALRWAQEQEAKVRTLDWTDPTRAKVTVGELAAAWFSSHEVKPKTRASYGSLLSNCVIPAWGTVRLDRVTTTGVKTWVTTMTGGRGRLLSASRRRQAYHLLTAILDAAVQDGRIPRNPARPAVRTGSRSGFLPALPQSRSRRYLRHEEVVRLADASGDYRTLVLVLAYCGLRWGEVAALRVRNVDLLKRRFVVEQSLADVNGELIFGPTKTHAARTVPVPSVLGEPLALAMSGKGRDDLLFTSPMGAPLRLPNWRRRVFDPAVTSAGLEGLTPHGLRHTAASLAVASGASVKGVQRMLGHKDAAMTLNVYADLFDDELDAVVGRLDEAILKASADSLRTAGSAAVVSISTAGPSIAH
jgi:integrase